METTVLYAELIIIGLETAVWVWVLSALLTDLQICSYLKYFLEKAPAAILLLGLLYVVGMTMDRAADMLFSKLEATIKKKSKLEASSSMLVWKRAEQQEYFAYTRSRIRILRSSTINFAMITLSMLLFVNRYMGDKPLFLLFIAVIGLFFSGTAFVSYKRMVESFYEKAHILEIEQKKTAKRKDKQETK